VVVFHAESSPVAGSVLPPLASPLANVAVVPPTREAVPLPIAGSVVPVAVLLSGVGELNVHWVMIVVVAVAGCAIPSMPAKSNASITAAITRRCAATGRRLG
jgi:hypothetical protein